MKIKNINHHDMTTKEFKGFTKTSGTFGAWRQVAKTINFATLFGATAPTMAGQLENAGYTEQEALEYIKILGKEAELEALVKSKRMGPKPMPRNKVVFLEAANLMLEAYYKAYPGVKVRSEREIKNAWEKGYSRCWGGPVRHLAELRYMKRNSKGEILGADRKLFSSMVSNRQNQAGNSPIQCMEAYVAMSTIEEVCKYVDEWNLKSYLWNMVHDSEDWCVYKPESYLVTSLIDACSTWHRQPEFNVFMKMDFSFADLSHGRQNNLYHAGPENPWKAMPIEDAVKRWNEEHKNVLGFVPIKWHGCRNN